MCALFEASGLSSAITKLMAPALKFFGIPETLAKFILIKPFSGSGSLSLLTEIIADNGADSYIARCACVMYGSSETVFYISAIYFAKRKKNKIILPILIVLTANILTAILSCFICQFL
jgi:spore maturation protein B